MNKQMLRCDICGGELEMQGGGKAVCTSCGMKYSTESIREKFQGLKVSVTGSEDDISQWKQLVKTYMSKHDFVAAESVVKKILEAQPSDQYANNLYTLLQEWKYLEVANGVLIKYHGRATDITLPDGIHTIEVRAFYKCNYIKTINLSHVVNIGIQSFEGCESLETIDLSNATSLGDGCFFGCHSFVHVKLSPKLSVIPVNAFNGTKLIEIVIPQSVKKIEGGFGGCRSLQTVLFSNGLEVIGSFAFADCSTLGHVSIPLTVNSIGQEAFKGCPLTDVKVSSGLLDRIYNEFCKRNYDRVFGEAPWWKNYVRQRRQNDKVCAYCGGEFTGLLIKKCSKCGKSKDY